MNKFDWYGIGVITFFVLCTLGIIAWMIGMTRWHIQNQAEAEVEDIKMSVWDEFAKDIEAAEGRATRVYRDSLGYPTGGIGHRLVGDELEEFPLGEDVSDAQVEKWLDEDTQVVKDSISKYFLNWDDYPHIAQLAVANWIFQLGADAPLQWTRATAAIVVQDWNTAADEFKYADPKVKRLSEWYRETPSRCHEQVERLRHAAKESR